MTFCVQSIPDNDSVKDKRIEMEPRTFRRIGIVGTGTFGRSLAKRLVLSGYDVIIGSRKPARRKLSEYDECLRDIQLTTVTECVRLCEVVFVAVHAEHFQETLAPLTDIFTDIIVIDVSNRDSPSNKTSNAEFLQSLLPTATVVKAFNTTSAYIMENDIAGGSRNIFVASNDVSARDRVSNLAREMGFVPVDLGRLTSSQRIEAYATRLFPQWKIPVLFTCIIFGIWFLYAIYLCFIRHTYSYHQLFLKVLNKPVSATAITVMALTYMPGCFAAFMQIRYGTKHKPFPRWLDAWLKSRKQLGVLCFILILPHVLMSVVLITPANFSSWFHSTAITIPANHTNDLHLPMKTVMIWKGEAACLAGIVAFVLLCLLATTTLPSVSDSLNWREWRFVQSSLGFTLLFVSAGHVLIMGLPRWIETGFPESFTIISFLCLILPISVVIMKLILLLPCVDKYVSKIRKGWERGTQRILTDTGTRDEEH
ncbi:metalloreductase STEAP4-like [Haliotis rubra]|uniref:metalloreductase STEAP4-like n=1 Tax=Haliotis rubra TaxID=36100 RepID=UPI001EE5DA38|nr:metalloreductase STEAP4-like [Haliotis rubra]